MNSFEPNRLLSNDDISITEELKRVYFKYYDGLQMTTKQFDKYSRVSARTATIRFGSWFLALEKADLVKFGAIRNITTSEILKDIERVILLNNGEYFTMDFYKKNGGLYSESTLKKYFENKKWREILFDEFKIYQVRKVIIVDKEIQKKTEEQLFNEIEAVWKKFNRRPTYSEFRVNASLGTKIFEKRFGSWTKAIEVFCLANPKYISGSTDKAYNTTKELLLQELQQMKVSLNIEILEQRDYKKYGGKYSVATFHNHFGSWKNALKLANLKSGREAPTEIELFDELQRIWEQLGKQPSQNDMKLLSKYSHKSYTHKFGGWTKAIYAFITDRKKEEVEEELLEEVVFFKPLNKEENANAQSPIKSESNLDNVNVIKMKTSRKIGNRLRFRVLERDNFTCQYCGKNPKDDLVKLEVDHINPYSNGGETIFENLKTACWSCNNGKSNIKLLQF